MEDDNQRGCCGHRLINGREQGSNAANVTRMDRGANARRGSGGMIQPPTPAALPPTPVTPVHSSGSDGVTCTHARKLDTLDPAATSGSMAPHHLKSSGHTRNEVLAVEAGRSGNGGYA